MDFKLYLGAGLGLNIYTEISIYLRRSFDLVLTTYKNAKNSFLYNMKVIQNKQQSFTCIKSSQDIKELFWFSTLAKLSDLLQNVLMKDSLL